jgi:hypothetical protein
MDKDLQTRLWATIGVTAAALTLFSCGPSHPPPEPAQSSTELAPTTVAATTVAELSMWPLAAPLKWDLSENAAVSSATASAPQGWSSGLTLEPTATASLHRIGFEGQYGGAHIYHVEVWVQGSPGIGAMLEARGKTLAPPELFDYAIQFFDLATAQPQANALTTAKTKVHAASGALKGPWSVLTVDFKSRDGWLFMDVTATKGGSHNFAGAKGDRLTIGRITVTQVS